LHFEKVVFMIVILNNGTRIKISNEQAQAILRQLVSDDARQWQCQFAGLTIISGFNLKQVSAICAEEDIISEPTVMSSSESVLAWCKQMVALSQKIAPDNEKK